MRAGANAVKAEGVAGHADVIGYLVESGIPVMGHLGLTPQSVHALGGHRVQAREPASAARLQADAAQLEHLGPSRSSWSASRPHWPAGDARAGDTDHRHRRGPGDRRQVLVLSDSWASTINSAAVRPPLLRRGGDRRGGASTPLSATCGRPAFRLAGRSWHERSIRQLADWRSSVPAAEFRGRRSASCPRWGRCTRGTARCWSAPRGRTTGWC